MPRINITAAIVVIVLIATNGMSSLVSEGSNGGLKLGVEVDHFNYDEPGVMKESGLLYGVCGSLSIDVFETLWLGFDGSIVAGDLTYDGSVNLSDGSEIPLELETPNAIFNFRATGGFVFGNEDESGELLVYSGLAYRLLIDDLAEASEQYGYTREQTYIYLPLGIRQYCVLNSAWVFGWSAEYDVLLDAENHSHGGALGGGVYLPQESGYGMRASVSLSSPRESFAAISLEAFVEKWDIDSSELVGGYVEPNEPKNESTLIGVRCSLCF